MSHQSQRPRTLRRRTQLFLRKYWIETFFGVLILLGAVLILGKREQLTALQTQLENLGIFFYHLALTVSPVDLFGAVMVILALAFLIWRIRVRFLASDRWYARICPRCGSPIIRVHRSLLDRMVGKIFLPHSRRYNCSKCNWSGLRHRGQHDHQHHTSD